MAPPPGENDYFRLRAEWLRFKNHVFDANTQLPTLAAVLDDVRRLMVRPRRTPHRTVRPACHWCGTRDSSLSPDYRDPSLPAL